MAASDIDLRKISAIFDMDGTLIDNTPFHFKAWQQLFIKHSLPALNKEEYLTQISGVPIQYTIEKYFGADIDKDKLKILIAEKQHLYEIAFTPYLRPINGLENFLAELKEAGIKIALATSSDTADIDFIFDTIPIRQYFDAIITGSMVSQPKPSPQIFLKAAERLNADVQNCVVFEDSVSGLKAGNNAGMKVIGITTGHSADNIRPMTDLVINDYADMSLQKLAALFDK